MFWTVRCLIVVFSFLSSIVIIVLWKRELAVLFFLWFVACVLSIIICLHLLFISLLGYDLWLWLFLYLIYTIIRSKAVLLLQFILVCLSIIKQHLTELALYRNPNKQTVNSVVDLCVVVEGRVVGGMVAFKLFYWYQSFSLYSSYVQIIVIATHGFPNSSVDRHRKHIN